MSYSTHFAIDAFLRNVVSPLLYVPLLLDERLQCSSENLPGWMWGKCHGLKYWDGRHVIFISKSLCSEWTFSKSEGEHLRIISEQEAPTAKIKLRKSSVHVYMPWGL